MGWSVGVVEVVERVAGRCWVGRIVRLGWTWVGPVGKGRGLDAGKNGAGDVEDGLGVDR